MKNILLIIILLSLLFSLISCDLLVPQPKYYIALGDSIPSGYGLEFSEESYPAVFYNLIKDNDYTNYVDEYFNMAVSGYTTTNLLEMFDNMDREQLSYIKNARIITLNIGGNNVLVPFLEYLNDLKVKSGAENIKTGAGDILTETEELLYVIIAEAEKVSSESDKTKTGFDDFILKLREIASSLLDGILKTIDGAWNILLGTPEAVSTFSGSFTPELTEKLDNGIKTFSNEFEFRSDCRQNFV
jgi:Lysophospholipase L1 and related esterases